MMKRPTVATALTVVLCLGLTTSVHAQQAASDSPWRVDFGIGWDNSISGNINSGGIGRLNNQAVVILKNRYEDVYGTGLHLRFGGGYAMNETTELRVTLTFQSLDADLTPMGDIGSSRLYGQYDDYQSLGLDFGYRKYAELSQTVDGYVEGTIGLAFIDKTDVLLSAPGVNLIQDATDFYDQTAAFTFGVNTGVIIPVHDRFDGFVQLGLRYVSGMSEIDDLAGTGLETINDRSSRWTVPFVMGARLRF
jgi:hypothetical protein